VVGGGCGVVVEGGVVSVSVAAVAVVSVPVELPGSACVPARTAAASSPASPRPSTRSPRPIRLTQPSVAPSRLAALRYGPAKPACAEGWRCSRQDASLAPLVRTRRTVLRDTRSPPLRAAPQTRGLAEDAGIVGDHAVDAGSRHALKQARRVHRPGEDRCAPSVASTHRGTRDDAVVEHRGRGPSAVQEALDPQREGSPQGDEPREYDGREQPPARDAVPVPRISQPAHEGGFVAGDLEQALRMEAAHDAALDGAVTTERLDDGQLVAVPF